MTGASLLDWVRTTLLAAAAALSNTLSCERLRWTPENHDAPSLTEDLDQLLRDPTRRRVPGREGRIHRSFRWKHGNHEHLLPVEIAIDDVIEAREQMSLGEQAKLDAAIAWVRKVRLADEFRAMARQHREPMHETVTSFAQHVPYRTSPVPGLLPAHLLASAVGDCDDKALLASAVLSVLGTPVALWAVPGHTALGVAVPGGRGWHVEHRGVRYYYQEVTVPGWRLGEMPADETRRVAPVLIFPPRAGPAPERARR